MGQPGQPRSRPDRARVLELFSLHWLAQQENVLFCRLVGVGKTFLAWADNSFERELRSWLAPDLLLLHDFGLRKLTTQHSSDFYDVLVERHRRAAAIITSSRAVDE